MILNGSSRPTSLIAFFAITAQLLFFLCLQTCTAAYDLRTLGPSCEEQGACKKGNLRSAGACDSNGIQHDEKFLESIEASEKISFMLSTFQEIVSDHVSLFQSTWTRHAGMIREPSSKITKENNRTNVFQHDLQSHFHRYEHMMKDFRNEPSGEDLFGDIEWDSEHDIEQYFDEIMSSCSKPKSKAPSMHRFKQCWGLLHRLVYDPLCTTRFDSRVSCSGHRDTSLGVNLHRVNNSHHDTSDLSNWKEKGVKLVKDHLTNDTINVVIIGGGPTGLALANALTELQTEDATSPWYTENCGNNANPQIRVLLFENRLENNMHNKNHNLPGRKKPFSRNWVTDLSRQLFIGSEQDLAFDPRMTKFWRLMSQLDSNIAVPINIIETLFLLSNRNRSHIVKFLYDDFRQYKDVLKDTPNMVVFDATGHRLNTLQRPSPHAVPDRSRISTSEYNPDSFASLRLHYRRVSHDHLQTLRKHKLPLMIAAYDTSETSGEYGSGGRITYPVLPNSLHSYHMTYAKINSFAANHDHMLGIDEEVRDEFDSTPNHRWTQTNPLCGHEGDYDSWAWCSPHSLFDTRHNYREDFEDILSMASNGFAARSMSLNLTPEQAKEMKELIALYSKLKNKGHEELSILDIPVTEILQRRSVFEANYVERYLLEVTASEIEYLQHQETPQLTGSLTLSTYEYHPYIYTDPLYHNDFFGNVPILRIGDSLLSGDANASTGVETHWYMILRLKCMLASKTDSCRLIFDKYG